MSELDRLISFLFLVTSSTDAVEVIFFKIVKATPFLEGKIALMVSKF